MRIDEKDDNDVRDKIDIRCKKIKEHLLIYVFIILV